MTCKNCIHYGVCFWTYAPSGEIDIFRLGGAETCEHFKQNKEEIKEQG